ncbi:MAG: MATE family efflux transporter [Flavobacteriales bacterium]|nr:MATE family efflux transporter [Flavobacteriales bacterium]
MERVSFKEIYRLAIPAILFNVVEPIIGMTDMAIIGRVTENATEAQGGVGLAAGLISLLVWSLAQLRTAVSAITSQYLGRGKIEQIRSLIPVALFASIFLGIAAWLLTAYFYLPISNFLYAKSNVIIVQQANIYYCIRAIGLPLSLFIACAFGIFRGLQDTSWAMVISLIGGTLNLILDLILVNGIGSIPAYGVAGAAWASVISQLLMTALCIFFIQKRTPFSLFYFRKKIHELKNMLVIFLNMFIRTIAVSGTFIIALRFANNYEELKEGSLAAYAIGINIWLFSSYFIDGFSNAGNAIAGKLLGEGSFKKLVRLRNDLLKINGMIGLGLALTYLASYLVIGDLFTEDLNVKTIFYSFFWIIIIMQPFNSIAFSYDGIFKGLGEAKALRNSLLLGTFGIFLPLLIGLNQFHPNLFSIWGAFAGWMLFRGLSLHLIFNRKYSLNNTQVNKK